MGMFNGRDLYAILIEDDNSMTITRKRRIVQGSNLVDHLCFLVNPEYNGHDMEKFDAVLSYMSPISLEMHEEFLCKSPESYKNLLTFVLPFDSKITDEAGPIDLMLAFWEHNGGECVRNITGATIDIIPDVSQEEARPDIGLDEINKQIAKVNKQIKEINKTSDLIIDTKADNVSYDNLTGDLQLMANGHPVGDIINIGLQNIDDFLKEEIATDDEIIEMLTQEDMLPVVADFDGALLSDENGNILLW